MSVLPFARSTPHRRAAGITVEEIDDGRELGTEVTSSMSDFDEALFHVRRLRQVVAERSLSAIRHRYTVAGLGWWENELRRLFCEARGNVVYLFRNASGGQK